MEKLLKRKTSKLLQNPEATANTAPSQESDQPLKEEILRWIFSILCSVACYTAIAGIVYNSYEPDIAPLQALAEKLLILPEKAIPEPMEALLFRLGVITIVPALPGFYALFARAKFIEVLAKRVAFLPVTILVFSAVAALVFAGFAATNIYNAGGKLLKEANTNFQFYFDGFFTGTYWWLYALLVVPAISYLFIIGMKKKDLENSRPFNRIVLFTGYAVTGWAMLSILLMNTFAFPYSTENKFDFNAVYFSMTQVYAGVPMLVDNFTNTYGLYPHFLNPLFQLIGLDVFKFSLVMSLLTGLCFVLNFYVLRKFVKNNILLFLGFATVLFFSSLNRKMDKFDCFFSFAPIRYLVPSVCLFMATLYFLKPSQKKYWATFTASAALILWNPEIGIVTYLSWILVNVYNDFYTAERKINTKKILLHLSIGICLAPAAFYLYKSLIYLFYGSSPDLSQVWSTMFIFGKVGFNLLPMSIIHPWNTVALIIIVGFTYAIAKWHKKATSPRASIILLLSLISTGYLFYFQGRSHNSNLALTSGFSIMLLTVMADDLWRLIKEKSIVFLNLLFVLVLALISFSFIDIVYKSERLYELFYQEDGKIAQGREQEFVEFNRDFILNNSAEGEKIHVMSLTKFHGLYFDGSKRISAFLPGSIDLFLKSDLERFYSVLRDSSFNIFSEPMLYNYPYMQRAAATVAACYEYKAHTQSMVLLTKRKIPIPQYSFFKPTASTVIHKKYDDSPDGITARVNDAFGVKEIKLAPSFSVQLLFYSTPQPYSHPTLVGNLHDGRGFAIDISDNASDLQFTVNNNSVTFPAQLGRPLYCVMNVFPDHFDVYINGKLVRTSPLEVPVMESESPLYIGNLGYMHYYLGAISEVAIDNNVIDSAEIQATVAQLIQKLERKSDTLTRF